MEFALFLKATLDCYLNAARSATLGLRKNWLIIPGSVVLFILAYVVTMLFARLGFAGGMLAGLLQTAFIALYYSWIHETFDREHLGTRELIQFDYGIFFNLIGVAFIIFIALFLVSHLIQGLGIGWILLFMQLGILFVFNAIPEVIIVHRNDGLQALSRSAQFTRENWIEWYLPLVVLLLPWLLINFNSALIFLSQSQLLPLLPPLIIVAGANFVSSFVDSALGSWALTLLGIFLGNWYMLFRVFLFKEFDSGTRRRRMYQAKNR